MNVKNFIIGGVVGGIADFLLGWLLWGMLFKDFFPPVDESQMNMAFIFLGCMTFGFFLSFVFNKWAAISTAMSGAKAGAILAFFIGLYHNFFHFSEQKDAPYQQIAVDIFLMLICGAIVGAIIGVLNNKLK